MSRIRRNFFLTALLGALLGAVTVTLWHDYWSLPRQVYAQDQRVFMMGFGPVVRKVTPAVVNISATHVVRARNRAVDPLEEFFFGPFFRGPRMPQPRRRPALGSGVIVTADGYVLTNNHVVEDAEDITVTLNDKREFKAKVVGTDPRTDVAVLKVESSGLPTLPWSDSSKVELGDIVLAIGNPFGIGQTVTMGIIGATGRSVGIIEGGYEDFLQTDAAINPGNSGGALVNIKGELVGINTAIISGSGGNQGIGFAIPSNLARFVMDQIVKTGKVTRGYIGAQLQEITPQLAEAFGLKSTQGVVITEVMPDSPGARAGLKPGDIVLEYNKTPVTDLQHFRLRVAQTPPGTRVTLLINREGKTLELPVVLGTLPDDSESRRSSGFSERGSQSPLEGVSVEELTPELARQLRLPSGVEGVVVSEVDPESQAAAAGLMRGDVIQSVNRQPVRSVQEFNRLVRQAGSPTVLLIHRAGAARFIVIEGKKQ